MKHGYKRAIAMLLAATVMTGLTACGGGSSSGGGSGSASGGSGDGTFTASGKTLNVGVQSNIISIPTVYAEEKGYFDDLGLDVNLIMFPNGSPENEGWQQNSLMWLLMVWHRFTRRLPACATGSQSRTAARSPQRFMSARAVRCSITRARFPASRICTAAQIP